MKITDCIYISEIMKRIGLEKTMKLLGELEKVSDFSAVSMDKEVEKLFVRLANMDLLLPQRKSVRALVTTTKNTLANFVIDEWNKLGLSTVLSRSPRRLRRVTRFVTSEEEARHFIECLKDLLVEKPALKRMDWFDLDYVFRSDATFEKVLQKRVYVKSTDEGRDGKKLSKEVLAFCEIGLKERNAIALWDFISKVKVKYESRVKGMFPMFSVICKAVKLAECDGKASGIEVLRKLDVMLGRTGKASFENYI